MTMQTPEDFLAAGDPVSALQALQRKVKEHPSDPKLRVFLFQLLSVLGQWDRALTQLNVTAEMDASALAMAQMYREALRCEALRAEVFAGKRSPLLFGQPDQWLALLIESNLVTARGDFASARKLRDQAFEMAPATRGSIDGKPFEWIADADMRLGPVCEAVINGKYYWIPFSRLARIDIEAPEDLRDFVWMPAHFLFQNGGEAIGIIPTRYPGSESCQDGMLQLARKTEWDEGADGVYTGLGQRVWTTDADEYPLMDARCVELQADAAGNEGEHSAEVTGGNG